MIRDSPYWNSSSGVSNCWLFSPLLTIFWSFPTAKCLLCPQLEPWGLLNLERCGKQLAKRFCMQGREGELGNVPSLFYSWNLSIEADWKGRWELIFKVHDLMSHQAPFIWSLHCNTIRARWGGQHMPDNLRKLRDKVCILVIVYRLNGTLCSYR